MDQFDPWQVVPRQVFTHYSFLLISTAFVVVSHVSCLRVTGVLTLISCNSILLYFHYLESSDLVQSNLNCFKLRVAT